VPELRLLLLNVQAVLEALKAVATIIRSGVRWHLSAAAGAFGRV
jgi:hypothetical protein